MAKQVQFTSKQKKGCLIGCLAPFILIGIILIIAASMDASDRNKKENAAEKSLDTSLSLEDRVTYAVTSVVGKENNMDEARDVKVEIAGKNATVRFLGDENLTTALTLTAYQGDVVEVLEALQPIKELQDIGVVIQTAFVDTYGNESIDDAVRLFITREELDKIKFDNFNANNINKLAYNYYVHPGMLK